MKFPTKVSCGGRSYVAHNYEQLDNICHVLSEGRYVDAERLFQSWEQFQREREARANVAAGGQYVESHQRVGR